MHLFISLSFSCEFRAAYGNLPDPRTDAERLNELANRVLIENNLPRDFFTQDFASDHSSADIVLNAPPTWSAYLPVCSVIGGILSQEIIKFTTKVGVPMRNVFVFSASDFVGREFLLSEQMI